MSAAEKEREKEIAALDLLEVEFDYQSTGPSSTKQKVKITVGKERHRDADLLARPQQIFRRGDDDVFLRKEILTEEDLVVGRVKDVDHGSERAGAKRRSVASVRSSRP